MRLLLVANRLPYKISSRAGKLLVIESEGGLATGLKTLNLGLEQHWIGWPGGSGQDSQSNEKISAFLNEKNIHPVFFSGEEYKGYYEGYSNKTIWPLFHYFNQYTDFNQSIAAYRAVNQKFCDAVLAVVEQGDIIWIHDYHLMLLPAMLREKLPGHRIGFFLHIPFPSMELFRLLPQRKELLNGLLGASLIGFHTYEYMRHFISSASRILGIPHTASGLDTGQRTIHVDSFPMGIDFDKYHEAPHRADGEKTRLKFREKFKDQQVILSIDRLDYSKGISNRLKAFDLFLEQHANFRGKVVLFLLVVPSRDNVDNYSALKKEIDHAVGNINGKYGTIDWEPIQYLYRSLDFKQLSTLYYYADVALVTPLRDGMNLVAKEYVAARKENGGVLVLSEMAGSSIELQDALLVNPYSHEEISNAIHSALLMPMEEQNSRMKVMQDKLRKQDISQWGKSFIETLEKITDKEIISGKKVLDQKKTEALIHSFSKAKNALLLLDYDGTLVPFSQTPLQASPDKELSDMLTLLSSHPNITVVIISGRDKNTLERWLGDTGVEMIAEHGTLIKSDGKWERQVEMGDEWKEDINELMKSFCDRTPGSFVEEKQFSLVWHYRAVDPWLADLRVNQLLEVLINAISRQHLKIIPGNKIIEVRVAGVDKGTASKVWLGKDSWDFVLAAGDDVTDEDLFNAMPAEAITLKAGAGETGARFRTSSWKGIRDLLKNMMNTVRVNQKAPANG